ncbi:MAG: CoA-binding protein [Flavobacteriales bacterium]
MNENQLKKRTLVMGASDNPDRYSNMAIRSLKAHGESVAALGRKPGRVEGVEILTGTPALEDIGTVTLYLSAANQVQFYDYIRSLHPDRVIFNPGAENPDLQRLLQRDGVEVLEACTLVMLSTGQYR